jgi:uncharacterized protein
MRILVSKQLAAIALTICALTGCVEPRAEGQDGAPPVANPAQRGAGLSYEFLNSQVFDLRDEKRGIDYQIYVSLPRGYMEQPERRYPVVYVTDADYGFLMLRLIGRRMNGEKQKLQEFILIGLSYAKNQDSMASRRRDYTPTPKGASDAPSDARHGESLMYRDYLRDTVLPFVDAKWRTRPDRRVYIGHSYGGLLGAQILMTEPAMFSGYVLGSPSFWYDKRHLLREMPGLLARRTALDAKVYLYVGEFEALRIGDRRYHQEVDMVGDNRTFADLLRAKAFKGLQLQSAVLADEDHSSIAPRGFTKGLLHVLPAE